MAERARAVLGRAAGIACLLLAILGIHCAMGEEGEKPEEKAASLAIYNSTIYFFYEVRIHEEPQYFNHPNLVEEGLEIDKSVLFHLDEGYLYVTVIREKWVLGGERVAMTTERPLWLEGGQGYRLTVFEESFRLQAADYVPEPEVKQDAGLP